MQDAVPLALEVPRPHPAEMRAVAQDLWSLRVTIDGACKGRCAWVGPDGKRCDSRWQVEVDHVDPAARGGRATLDRLRLLCRGHNLLHAEAVYGREHMQKYRKGTVTDLAGSGGAVPMAREAMAAG